MQKLVRAITLCGWLVSTTCIADPFNPDTDPSRVSWTELASSFGPSPDVRNQRFGVVLKTPTNEYWRLMTSGYRKRAAADGVKLDIQAAQNEADQARQLAMMQNMIGSGYKALLISPISASNLQPAVDAAKVANIPVLDVDGAVIDSVEHFIGPVNREMGVSVADWFIRNYPSGGRVAVVEGQAGVLSTMQRTAGFRDRLVATGKFQIAASVSADWDRERAFTVTREILRTAPDIIGLYCNNDTMALGAADAVKSVDAASRVKVFGSDGTAVAYAAIAAGTMTGTVDIFPAMIGELALDVAERLSVRQPVPRVVETPQILITRENIARYRGDDDARRRAIEADNRR